MKKEHDDGLRIDNSFQIVDEKKNGLWLSGRVVQFLMIMIGGWSVASILINSLQIPVDSAAVNMAVFICTFVFYLLCLHPRYDLVKLFFVVLFYGLFLSSRLSQLTNGVYIIENLIIDRLVHCYHFSAYYYLADYSAKTADTTLMLILFMIPVIGFLSLAIIRTRLVNLCSLILLLPLSASFMLGVIVPEHYLIAYIIAVLYLSRSGFSYRYRGDKGQLHLLHKINSRAAVCMILTALSVFFILKLFFPEDKYENIKELDTMKVKVQKTFSEISLEDISEQLTSGSLFHFTSGTGGLMGGDLGKNADIIYTGTLQLIVKAPLTSAVNGIYLKGYAGSNYNGSRWNGLTKEDRKLYRELLLNMPEEQFLAVNQTNHLLGLLFNGSYTVQAINNLDRNQYQIEQGTMQIEYKKANRKYIYAPYYTNYALLDQIRYEKDLYAAPRAKKASYEFNYYYNMNLETSEAFQFSGESKELDSYAKYEKLYRNYVYQVYTQLPEKGLDRLKNQFSNKNLPKGIKSTAAKINYVKSYLSANTVYTLAPGKLPKGEEFVEYFLYENKKGYCVHYATAATLMLRAMGVPARYAEGYAIDLSQVEHSTRASSQLVTDYTRNGDTVRSVDTVDIMVTDENAHAWVEVYIDGCGWIPVEVTPAARAADQTALIGNLEKVGDYISNNSSETEQSVQNTVKPAQTADQAKEQDDKDTGSGVRDTGFNWKQLAGVRNIFLVVILCVWIAAALFFLAIKFRKKRRINNILDYNRRVLILFGDTEKILSLCKDGLPLKKSRLEDCEEYIMQGNSCVEPRAFADSIVIIKKARFGKAGITQLELEEVEAFYRSLYSCVYPKLSFPKKIYLKLLLLIEN